MTSEMFVERIRFTAIKTYISVYGEEKWNSLTNEERATYMHIVVNALGKLSDRL